MVRVRLSPAAGCVVVALAFLAAEANRADVRRSYAATRALSPQQAQGERGGVRKQPAGVGRQRPRGLLRRLRERVESLVGLAR